jgi:hypothetical protein
MQVSKRQLEFWMAILILCLITAIIITLVDFSIKASILEQSNKIRLEIEEWNRGQGRGRQAEDGASYNADNNSPLPGDVLGKHTTGLETRYPDNKNTGMVHAASKTRAEHRSQDGNREIPSGDKQMGA